MIRWGMGWDCGWDSTYIPCCFLALSAFFSSSDRASVRARSSIVTRVGQRSFGWYHENNLLFTFVSPSTCTMQSISTWCNSSVPPFVHAVVPPSDKWRPLRNLSRVTSCIGVAGVSVDGNWDACAQWVYAWLERTFYTVQKVKGGVHFHQHVLQSDNMAGEVRSGLLSSRHRLEPKKAVESRSR